MIMLDSRGLSPELVMIDPELRQFALEWLEHVAQAERAVAVTTTVAVLPGSPAPEPPPRAAPTGSEISPPKAEVGAAQGDLADRSTELAEARTGSARRRFQRDGARLSGALGVFLSAAFFGSLLMNLGFIGFFVGSARDSPTLASSPAASSAPAAVQRNPAFERLTPAARAKAIAEQSVFAFLLRNSSSLRLPALMTDPQTGLLRNNVRVVCKAVARERGRRFACFVEPPHPKQKGGLSVLYRVDSAGTPHVKVARLRPVGRATP